jgi:hypothetical protein
MEQGEKKSEKSIYVYLMLRMEKAVGNEEFLGKINLGRDGCLRNIRVPGVPEFGEPGAMRNGEQFVDDSKLPAITICLLVSLELGFALLFL